MIDAPTDEIAAANAYQALFVPALFQQWAPRVADAARIAPGQRVLDVACGTGVLAREAASRTGDMHLVSGLDAAAGMLAVAARLAPNIDWRQGRAESLPFDAATFDAVVCQFGLMFFQDRSMAVREMHRVLKKRGRVAVVVWDSLENSEAYRIEVGLLERLAGRRAADALRAPFVLGNRADSIRLLQDAGFSSIESVTQHGRARFPSIRTMVEADLRGWLPIMDVHLTEEQIATILAEAEQALAAFVTADNQVEFAAPAHIVSAYST